MQKLQQMQTFHEKGRPGEARSNPEGCQDGLGMLGDRSCLLNSGFEVSAVQQSIS
jgi:hypothetical protein